MAKPNRICWCGNDGYRLPTSLLQRNLSARHGERDTTGDPWDGRTLEWATHSPVQHYNFAKLPEIKEADAFWYMKNAEKQLHQQQKILNQFTCQVTLVCLLLRLDSSVLQVSH